MFAITTMAMLAFLPAVPAPDSSGIILKVYEEQQGDVREVTRISDAKTTVMSDLNPKAAKAASISSRDVYKEEIIEKDKKEKRASKLRRTYSQARGIKDGKETTLAYEGKVVMIEKKGDKYEFSVNGKALDKKDAEHLDKEWNQKENEIQNHELLPKQAVKISDKWEIDPALAIKDLENTGLVGDPKNSKVSGKLIKTYSKGEQLYGVIEVDIDVAIKSIKQGGMEVTAKEGSKFSVHMEIETAIDGSRCEDTVKGTIKSEIKIESRGAIITVTGEVEGKDVSKPVKK